jgi:hypothetical protein
MGMARMLMAATLVLGLAWAGPVRAQVRVVGCGPQAPDTDPSKPLGRWTRKIDKTHVRLDIEEGRLHLRCAGEKSLVIHADYQITRDRVVYGVITSVECEEEDTEGLVENLVDAPFSFGFRLDEGTLSIRDLKCTAEEFNGKKWTGRFKAVESEKPIRLSPPAPTYAPAAPVAPVAPLSGSVGSADDARPGVGALLGGLASAAIGSKRDQSIPDAAPAAGLGAIAGGLIGAAIENCERKAEAQTAPVSWMLPAVGVQQLVELPGAGHNPRRSVGVPEVIVLQLPATSFSPVGQVSPPAPLYIVLPPTPVFTPPAQSTSSDQSQEPAEIFKWSMGFMGRQ